MLPAACLEHRGAHNARRAECAERPPNGAEPCKMRRALKKKKMDPQYVRVRCGFEIVVRSIDLEQQPVNLTRRVVPGTTACGSWDNSLSI